jgi:hypothetical protein
MTVTKAQVTRIMKAVERRGYNINEDLARVVASVIGEIPDILDYMIAMAREDERKDLNYADYKRAAKLNTKLSGPLTKKEKEIKIREEIEDEKPIKPTPLKRVYAKKAEVKKRT